MLVKTLAMCRALCCMLSKRYRKVRLFLPFRSLQCNKGDEDKVGMVSDPGEYSENSDKAYSHR